MIKKSITLLLMFTLFAITSIQTSPNAVGESTTPAASPAAGEEKVITAYINGLQQQNGEVTITVDPISWYQGEAANEVFRQLEPEGYAELGGTPDGYYIVNNTEEAIPYNVDSQAEVLMQLYDHTGNPLDAEVVWNEPVSLNKFTAIYNHDGLIDTASFPYHLTIKDGKVIKIVQQYVP
ncbi:hypothetical protein DCC85_21000 [Paenibacillus sp. CAA11]|uniref:hypothetical protein n=1 Tax=Paenibacillus sp. CAA11 TaxID=1532905 RepID=UPI000D34764A|nr:hypothetical protein [Paenibacillus sp. CAA11]AWB46398.1 hypothetical protein DCC85_21000 [Paenibacillus sp. CAA11]